MSKHISCVKILKKESGISIFERFSSISNALSAFLLKKKKSDAAPKSDEEGGDEKQLCFFMRPKECIQYECIPCQHRS